MIKHIEDMIALEEMVVNMFTWLEVQFATNPQIIGHPLLENETQTKLKRIMFRI
jgi:hypothetical protein